MICSLCGKRIITDNFDKKEMTICDECRESKKIKKLKIEIKKAKGQRKDNDSKWREGYIEGLTKALKILK
jgi:ribosome-binding protein aMBF1 (putative translation factor)